MVLPPENGRPLFSSEQFFDFRQKGEESVRRDIDEMDGDELLNVTTETLADRIVETHRVEVPTLHDTEVEASFEEAKVNTTGRALNPSWRQPTGTRYDFHVPFDGDADLFRVRPTQYLVRFPIGRTDGQELVFSYLTTPQMGGGATASNAVKSQFDQDLRDVQTMLTNLRADGEGYNHGLHRIATERIENRRAKLFGDRNIAQSLGVPIRRREGQSLTYVHPGVRRKAPAVVRTAPRPKFAPEPALDLAEYEHILSVISDMARVMELSPSAFEHMNEEDLRFMFLFALNGHYESVLGEAFNFGGKTDILIRAEGKNTFVAECKFWRGPQAFIETIDQLLGYASWRDTKTAIVLFNRERSLSRLLQQIPGLLQGHPNFRRMGDFQSETGFRCTLHHRDDPDRDLILTVLVFEVPSGD